MKSGRQSNEKNDQRGSKDASNFKISSAIVWIPCLSGCVDCKDNCFGIIIALTSYGRSPEQLIDWKTAVLGVYQQITVFIRTTGLRFGFMLRLVFVVIRIWAVDMTTYRLAFIKATVSGVHKTMLIRTLDLKWSQKRLIQGVCRCGAYYCLLSVFLFCLFVSIWHASWGTFLRVSRLKFDRLCNSIVW